jgi:uncharacterized RDD family membrane protein YckC
VATASVPPEMAATAVSSDAATVATVAAAGGPASSEAPGYAGLATRALGIVIDALLIQLVALFTTVSALIVLRLLHLPADVKQLIGVIGAVAYVLWSIGYFVSFWSGTGQTPGARVMQVRVTANDGSAVSPRWAFVRCIGLVLAALPLFLGYAPILFDARRRGLPDWLARTVVVHAPQMSIAAARMRPPRPPASDRPHP